MVKFMIVFHIPDDLATFEQFYNSFLAQAEHMPGITRRQVNTVWGSPAGDSPYYRVLEIYFADKAGLETALRSQAGQAAGAQLQNFPADRIETLFADVYEEKGGQTPAGEVSG